MTQFLIFAPASKKKRENFSHNETESSAGRCSLLGDDAWLKIFTLHPKMFADSKKSAMRRCHQNIWANHLAIFGGKQSRLWGLYERDNLLMVMSEEEEVLRKNDEQQKAQESWHFIVNGFFGRDDDEYEKLMWEDCLRMFLWTALRKELWIVFTAFLE